MLNQRMFLLSGFLVILVSACATATQNIEGENWVAFSAETAQKDQMLDWLFPSDAEYWSPTAADIRALESALPAYLQENRSAFYMTETLIWKRLDEYNRQYIGVVLGGKKIIYASFLCQGGANTEWKEHFILVADGGACYFQFKYEPSTGGYYDLSVNGEA